MTNQSPPSTQTILPATFAGGCFWCLQGPFDAEAGVSHVRVGYAGGTAHEASYYTVASGTTKHREAISMLYDPSVVSYQALLEIFFRQIDPTDPNGQFADQGFQYTTAIYYHSDDQRQTAQTFINQLDDSGKFSKPIVTAVEPFTTFFEAEDEHQAYYKKNPLRYMMYKKGSGRSAFMKKMWE